MPAIFHKGVNYSAVGSDTLADKKTQDTLKTNSDIIKTDTVEIKTTLANKKLVDFNGFVKKPIYDYTPIMYSSNLFDDYTAYVYFKGCIHCFGGIIYKSGSPCGTTDHTKINITDNFGDTEEVSTIPFECLYGKAIVVGDYIHLLCGNKHYKWSESGGWESVSTSLPFYVKGDTNIIQSPVREALYASTLNEDTMYYFDCTDETLNFLASSYKLPYAMEIGTQFLANPIDGKLYYIGGQTHKKSFYCRDFTEGDTAWYNVGDLPIPVGNEYTAIMSGDGIINLFSTYGKSRYAINENYMIELNKVTDIESNYERKGYKVYSILKGDNDDLICLYHCKNLYDVEFDYVSSYKSYIKDSYSAHLPKGTIVKLLNVTSGTEVVSNLTKVDDSTFTVNADGYVKFTVIRTNGDDLKYVVTLP